MSGQRRERLDPCPQRANKEMRQWNKHNTRQEMLYLSSKECFPLEAGNPRKYPWDVEEGKRGRQGEEKASMTALPSWSRHKVRKKFSGARMMESPFLDLAFVRRGSTPQVSGAREKVTPIEGFLRCRISLQKKPCLLLSLKQVALTSLQGLLCSGSFCLQP